MDYNHTRHDDSSDDYGFVIPCQHQENYKDALVKIATNKTHNQAILKRVAKDALYKSEVKI